MSVFDKDGAERELRVTLGHTIPVSSQSKYQNRMRGIGSGPYCRASSSYIAMVLFTTISSLSLKLDLRFVLTVHSRPANILLSTSNVPVLVDFGFAKQYDPQAPDAFHSNLSYGTPEV